MSDESTEKKRKKRGLTEAVSVSDERDKALTQTMHSLYSRAKALEAEETARKGEQSTDTPDA